MESKLAAVVYAIVIHLLAGVLTRCTDGFALTCFVGTSLSEVALINGVELQVNNAIFDQTSTVHAKYQ